MIRRSLVLAAAVASLALLLTTTFSAGPSGASAAVASTAAGRPAGTPPLARPGVIAAGPTVRMSPAEASRAALRCASWASKAGFANNGPSGHLVVAVAIALAESGCDPQACLNDTTHRECTPSGTRHSHDSIDRGAWQINSHYWPNVSNQLRVPRPVRRAHRLPAGLGRRDLLQGVGDLHQGHLQALPAGRQGRGALAAHRHADLGPLRDVRRLSAGPPGRAGPAGPVRQRQQRPDVDQVRRQAAHPARPVPGGQEPPVRPGHPGALRRPLAAAVVGAGRLQPLQPGRAPVPDRPGQFGPAGSPAQRRATASGAGTSPGTGRDDPDGRDGREGREGREGRR